MVCEGEGHPQGQAEVLFHHEVMTEGGGTVVLSN